MKRDPLVYLWDARHAAESILEFVGDVDFSHYSSNAMLRSAVERQFEIIGEALNQLDKRHPNIGCQIPSLREVVNFRNLLIHECTSVNHAIVWKTIKTSLPELLHVINDLIDRETKV